MAGTVVCDGSSGQITGESRRVPRLLFNLPSCPQNPQSSSLFLNGPRCLSSGLERPRAWGAAGPTPTVLEAQGTPGALGHLVSFGLVFFRESSCWCQRSCLSVPWAGLKAVSCFRSLG